MQQFLASLDRELLGNPLHQWLTAAGIALAVALGLYAVKRLVARRFAAVAAQTATQVDDVVVELLGRTRLYFIAALAVRAAMPALVLAPRVVEAVQDVTTVAVLLQLARWGTGLISYWIASWSRSRSGGDERATSATLRAIGVMARGVLWSVVLLLALKNVWDFDITALITGLGVGGIAIALAVQNILGDAFAALSIVLDKPFDIGDTIAVDTSVGTVEHIGLKTTRIRALSGEQIIFSNAELLKIRVRNLKRMAERRVVFMVGVTYDTAPDLVERIPTMLREIVERQPQVRFDRAHFARFMDSSLEFEVVYFMTTPDYLPYMDTQQAINVALLRTFNEAGISFAFPTRTIVHQTADGGRPGEEAMKAAVGAADAAGPRAAAADGGAG